MNLWRDDLRYFIFLISPFILFILGHWIYDLFFAHSYRSDQVRVKLRNSASVKEEPRSSDKFVESFIFGRTENFKNDPRGNVIFLKSLHTVSLVVVTCAGITFLIFILCLPCQTLNIDVTIKDEITLLLAVMAAVNGLSWLENRKIAEKWNYLSGLYNKLIDKKSSEISSGKRTERSLQLNALAIDILVTMMWGHRSFKELFLLESQKAVSYFCGYREDNPISLLNKKNKFHFSEAELLFILENYQRYLLGYDSIKNINVYSCDWLTNVKKIHYNNIEANNLRDDGDPHIL